jgi:tetratricopeptide (TPR) repeat protein
LTTVERWANAVLDHVPGQADEPLRRIERLTVEDRAELQKDLELFRDALTRKPARPRSDAERRIAALGSALANHPGASRFVDLAIVSHGDAAIVAIGRLSVAPAVSSPLSPLPKSGVPPVQQQVLERDGDLVGTIELDWNWEFARSLIRWRLPDAHTAFYAKWFHATSALLMSVRRYGEARHQLEAAVETAPRDARLLFDRASYFEMQGLPESQVLLSDEDLMAIRVQRNTSMRGNLITRSEAATRTGLRPAPTENADAERLFRAAIAIDPGFVEARVRLARLLAERGRHDDAASELAAALASEHSDPAVTYFAHLFSGREDRVRGQFDSAVAHFRAALDLFPGAQSALLGLSQIAVLRSDAAGALEPIRELQAAAAVTGGTVDPWWRYSTGLGRNADALLAEMWSSVRRQ